MMTYDLSLDGASHGALSVSKNFVYRIHDGINRNILDDGAIERPSFKDFTPAVSRRRTRGVTWSIKSDKWCTARGKQMARAAVIGHGHMEITRDGNGVKGRILAAPDIFILFRKKGLRHRAAQNGFPALLGFAEDENRHTPETHLPTGKFDIATKRP